MVRSAPVRLTASGLQSILSEENDARLTRGLSLVLAVGWAAHGLRAWFLGGGELAGVYGFWSLLFLCGGVVGPRLGRRWRAHGLALLFFSGAGVVLLVAGHSEPPSLWGMVAAPAVLWMWAGRRAALVWVVAVLGLLGLEAELLSSAGRLGGWWNGFLQRATTLGALLFVSDGLLRVLQGHHDRLVEREQALEEQARQMEQQMAELQKARDEALEGGRLKSNFLATMSHELRTPLNAVLGMANLLQHTQLSDEQQEYTTTIVGGSQALLTLIGDILDLSKLEAGKLEVERVSVDLHHVAEQALSLVCAQAHGKGVELYFAPHPQAPAGAVTDPARLQQILVNLLSNAVKFTDEGDVVLELAPGDGPGEVRFTVRDTGVGIAPEMLGKLFRPFSQVGAGNQRGGTGLGLMICHALVGLLGGQISVESAPGKGSSFSFTIRSQGEPQSLSLSGLIASIPGNVLVLDARERSGLLLRETLQGIARRVEVFRSPSEFFVALASSRVDVVVIDPRVGFEPPLRLLQRLVDLEEALPPVVLLYPKGAPDRQQIEAFFSAHFQRTGSALWTKPVMPRQLLQGALTACLGEVTAERSVLSRPRKIEGGSRLRILVAEDNPTNQRVVAKMLGKLGHEVELVENGELAVAAVQRGRVDVVLLDVQMPVMDGLEAARKIVQSTPRKLRPRLIGLTANALAGDRERCLAAGMDDYLTKPVQLQDLAGALGGVARPAQPATQADVVDPHVATQLRLRHGPAELEALLAQISGQLSADGEAIFQSFSAGDLSTVEVLAGRLKERCATVGLARLYAVLTKIEHDARAGAAGELTRYVGRLAREVEQGKRALLRLSSSAVGATASFGGALTGTRGPGAEKGERSGRHGP